MRVMVTGAAGFIGSHLARRLLDEGHEVVGLDAFTTYYDPAFKRRNLETVADEPNWEMIEGDLNVVDLANVLSDVEVVFHQAGQPGVRKSWGREFAHYVDSNVSATQRLLEAATEAPRLTRLVYASSSSVYGAAERYPTSETDVPAPLSPYGVSKLAAEHLCGLYAATHGLPTVSLRYFTVYGPRQRPDMAFTRFMSAILRGQPIEVFGDGEQERDFTFVEDIVEANIRAAFEPGVSVGRVYNVAGGTNVSVNHVLEVLGELAGPLEVRHLPEVRGDVRKTGGDTKRILDELGWSPVHSLEEGLSTQWKWAQSAGQK